MVGGAQLLCFAVPSDTVQWVVSELLRHGRVRRAWLGIAARTVALARRTALHHGITTATIVTVDEVTPGSPAQLSGIQPVDRVFAIDGEPVADVDGLHRQLGGGRIGRKTSLSLLRGIQRVTLDVVPSAQTE